MLDHSGVAEGRKDEPRAEACPHIMGLGILQVTGVVGSWNVGSWTSLQASSSLDLIQLTVP